MHVPQDYFRELCRQRSWRCTAQRRTVYEYLDANRVHPDVETVWTHARERIPDISLDSVYRILADFCEGGIVRRLEGGRSFRYDINTRPHEHFACTVCGQLFDVPLLDEKQIIARCRFIGKATSFELAVRGVCNRCLAAGMADSAPALKDG